ncbi:MAG: YIP1 family protein [bacterium]|nr:YIP1 family protein [bacterium]
MSHDAPEIPPPGSSFPDTWRRVMTDPRGFFADMPQAGGLAEPLTFLAAVAAVNAAGRFLICWCLGGAVWTFIATIALGFVVATLLTLVAQHLFDGRGGFEPTFRAVAYGFAPAVFFWVPRLGILAALYALFLQVRGTERVHTLDAVPAVLSVLIAAAATVLVAAGLGGRGLL